MALDFDRFVRDGRPGWERLRELLRQMEGGGLSSAPLETLHELAELYRRTASDLLRAQDEGADPALLEALNALVARAHALLHGRRPARRWPPLRELLVSGFRRTLHANAGLLRLAALVLLAGLVVGAVAVTFEPRAVAVFVPEGFAHEPAERVARDTRQGVSALGQTPLSSGAFLFTHNLRVTLLLFGLGVTWGLGVLALLFYNGLLLGAMGADYAAHGQLEFFLAWVLPHGVPEISAVLLGGTAGLIVGRALWLPGDLPRTAAAAAAARQGGRLLLGAAAWLAVAGALEATLSQMHPPMMPYAAKFTVAALGALGLWAHWVGFGRSGARDGAGASAPPVSSAAPASPASPPSSAASA